MKETGWSQERMGQELRLSQAHIGKLLAGSVESVGIKHVETAIEIFKLDPAYFFDPGPVDMNPAEYERSKRKTQAQRIEALERSLAGSRGDIPETTEEWQDFSQAVIAQSQAKRERGGHAQQKKRRSTDWKIPPELVRTVPESSSFSVVMEWFRRVKAAQEPGNSNNVPSETRKRRR